MKKLPFIAIFIIVLLTSCSSVPNNTKGPKLPKDTTITAKPSFNTTKLRGLLQNREWAAAEVIMRKYALNEKDVWINWYNLSLLYFKQDKYQHALNSIKKGLLIEPKQCSMLNLQGKIYTAQGKFFRAESAFKSCIESDDSYLNAYLNLGILYELYLGKLEDASFLYKAYLEEGGENENVSNWIQSIDKKMSF